MDHIECPNNTVIVSWSNRIFYYRRRENESGYVYFRERKRSANDLFRLCCSIAIVQDYCTDRDGITSWSGADDAFLDRVIETFNWRLSPRSRDTYWTYLSKGKDAGYHITDTYAVDNNGNRRHEPAIILFSRIHGYIFGEPVIRSDGTYQVWRVKFNNADEEFEHFREQVLNIMSLSVSTVHGTSPVCDLTYLLTVEQVLETRKPPDAEWFRKTGPAGSDFEKGRVHRRKVVDILKKKLLHNPAYLLVGVVATGKTVIVRNIIYEFYKEGRLDVYYFDIAHWRNFDEGHLIREIQSIKGEVIIENVHLESQKVQHIYRKFKNDPDRHILFTSRPPYEEFQDKFSEDLMNIPKISQEPFVDSEEVIKLYCTDAKTPSIVWERRKEILKVSKNNFWLLAFALQGCADAKGHGDPQKWIADEVHRYLRNLENCRDQYANQYPGILVALSPLYINEVLTVESYLRKFGFTRPALNSLVERAEITRQEYFDGNVFYGLTHSSLAEAYWRHGREYRKSLPDYEKYIYDYGCSGSPNSLEAIAEEAELCDRLTIRLDANGLLAKVVEREQSIAAVQLWLMTGCWNITLDEDILKILARKVEKVDDISYIPKCVVAIYRRDKQSGQRFWRLLDRTRLKSKIVKKGQLLSMIPGIGLLSTVDVIVARELCKWLNIGQLAAELEQEENVRVIGKCISTVFFMDKKRGRELWKLLDKKRLATKLERMKDISSGKVCIDDICRTSKDIARELFESLQMKKLALVLDETKGVWHMVGYVSVIRRNDKDVGWRLWRLLDKKRLAQKLSRTKKIWTVQSCIKELYAVDPTMASKLCNLISTEEVAPQLVEADNVRHIGEYICMVYQANPKVGRKLLRALNKEQLAARISQAKKVSRVEACIGRIHSVDPIMAGKLCEILDYEKLASLFTTRRHIEPWESCLKVIERADSKAAQNLRKRLGE